MEIMDRRPRRSVLTKSFMGSEAMFAVLPESYVELSVISS